MGINGNLLKIIKCDGNFFDKDYLFIFILKLMFYNSLKVKYFKNNKKIWLRVNYFMLLIFDLDLIILF